MARLGHTIGSTEVTWQGAVILCGFIYIGLMTAIYAMLLVEPDQRGMDTWLKIYWISVPVVFALCLLVVWYRLHRIRLRGQRARILNQLGWGLALTVIAVGLTLFSQKYWTMSFLGERWYIFPIGLYLTGMAFVANAMNPKDDP